MLMQARSDTIRDASPHLHTYMNSIILLVSHHAAAQQVMVPDC